MDSAVSVRSETPFKPAFYVILVCMIISVLLQLAGIVTPGWAILEFESGSEIQSGIWYIILCAGDSQDCKTYSFTSYAGVERTRIAVAIAFDVSVKVYQALTSVALAGSIAVVIFLGVRMRTQKSITTSTCSLLLAIIVCFVSGVCSFVAVGMQGNFMSFLEGTPSTRDVLGIKDIKTPYSLILVGIGGVITGLCFIFLAVLSCLAHARSKRDRPRSSSAAMPYNTQIQRSIARNNVVELRSGAISGQVRNVDRPSASSNSYNQQPGSASVVWVSPNDYTGVKQAQYRANYPIRVYR